MILVELEGREPEKYFWRREPSPARGGGGMAKWLVLAESLGSALGNQTCRMTVAMIWRQAGLRL